MERLPDRHAAKHLKYHLGWKLALHQPLGLESFDPSGLFYFRQRLIEHEKAKLAFDAVLEGLRKAGLIKTSHKQRLDSTYVLGLVAHLSAAERLRESLRLALQELADVQACGEACVAAPFWAELWERYVQGKLDWQLSEVELKAKFHEARADMQGLLGWLKEHAPAGLELPRVKLLARVFAENFEEVAC
jgi:hypothetical protein